MSKKKIYNFLIIMCMLFTAGGLQRVIAIEPCTSTLQNLVEQTNATYSSVAVAWPKQDNVSGYFVYVNGMVERNTTLPATSTYFELDELSAGQQVTISVTPFVEDEVTSVPDYGTAGEITASTLSDSKGLALDGSGFSTTKNYLSVCWDVNEAADGYEIALMDSNNKIIKTVVTESSSANTATFSNVKRNQSYRVKMRSFVMLSNEFKQYGNYSNTINAIPQPVITTKVSEVQKDKIKMRWGKVKGATSYTVYVSRSLYSRGSKITTTKKNYYTITKYKKKKINTWNHHYYIRIVTNTKLGGKKVSSKSAFATDIIIVAK